LLQKGAATNCKVEGITMAQDSWYAVHVRARSEFMGAANLGYKGYEPFVPTYRHRRCFSDGVKMVNEPLFPRYLCCLFDVGKRLPILTTPGVNSIVSTGKIPTPVSDAEIDSIRTVVGSGLLYAPHPYLTSGQRVRVQRGALCGLTGVVTEVRNQFRLIISVKL